MATITYIARRAIIPTHTLDEEYTVEFKCIGIGEPYLVKKETRRALSGRSQQSLYYLKRQFPVVTAPYPPANKPLWEEIEQSIAAGESFTLDVYGTVAVPVNPLVCKVDGVPGHDRVADTDYFQTSFNAVNEA